MKTREVGGYNYTKREVASDNNIGIAGVVCKRRVSGTCGRFIVLNA